jgi:hypothetical protein
MFSFYKRLLRGSWVNNWLAFLLALIRPVTIPEWATAAITTDCSTRLKPGAVRKI